MHPFTPEQEDIMFVATKRRYGLVLFRIDELARFLGISVRTIQRLHAKGYGPDRIKEGRRYVYKLSSLRRWLTHRATLELDLNMRCAKKFMAQFAYLRRRKRAKKWVTSAWDKPTS